jgi:hypothetical protein
VVDAALVRGLQDGSTAPPADLVAHRVILDIPPKYL